MKLHDLWKPIPAKPGTPSRVTKTGEVQPARPPQPPKPPPKPHPPVPPSKPPTPPQPPHDGGEFKPPSRSNKSNNQSRASKRPGRSRRRSVRVGHGDGPPSGDARDRGSRTRNGPDDSAPTAQGVPPAPAARPWYPLVWSVGPACSPQPHPLGGLWFCSWVETLAYPDPSHRPLGSSSRSPPGPVSQIPGVRASRETLNLRRDRETRIGPPRRSSERHPTGLI